jgi:hypothetical protein
VGVVSPKKPVDRAKNSAYYVSMLMGEEAVADKDPTAMRHDAVRLTFRSSNDFWGDRVCFGLLPGMHKLHIELADYIRFTGTEVPEGQSLLWAAKIVAQRHGQDEIFFRIYREGESLDIVEPADWSIATRGVRSDAQLDWLLLTSTGPTRRRFDEIRIGTSWRAVIPIERRTRIELAENAESDAGAREN